MPNPPALPRALLAGAGIVFYALAMHHTLAVQPRPDLAAALLIAPVTLASLLAAWNSAARLRWLTACGLAAITLAGLWPLLTRHIGWLYFLEHVTIFGLLGLLFGRSLMRNHTPLCTQIGAVLHERMSERSIHYTRQVTVAWTIFFSASVGVSALLFFFASFEAWSFFANVLGMPLMGALFAGEFAVRCHVLPPEERGSLLGTIQAWNRRKTPRTPAPDTPA